MAKEINKNLNHNEIKQNLRILFPKRSVFIMGRTGIGKSQIVKEEMKDIAKSLNKPFIEWNKISLEEKHAVAYAKDSAFVFVDVRLSMKEPTDLTGIPFPDNGACIYKKQLWVHCLHNNPGCLFLDEMNLASPSVLSATYQIIYDKTVDDIPLHKNCMVVAAGNKQEDKAYTFELPLPVIARQYMYELDVPDTDDWLSWAINNAVDSRIITYIAQFKNMLFYENDDAGIIITPRTWGEFVGQDIKGIEDYDLIRKLVIGCLKGKAFDFVEYIKLKDKLPTAEDVLNKKAKFPKEELSKQFLMTSILAAYYGDAKNKNVKTLKKLFELREEMDTEFHILLLRMVRATDGAFFKEQVLNDKEMRSLVTDHYVKYLVD